MAVIFGPSPVNLHSGDNLSPVIQVDDPVTRLDIIVTRWTAQNRTVQLIVETSFDNGSTWVLAYAIGPIGPPVDRKGNNVDLNLNIPAWRMCTCGQPFDPTVDNSHVIVHSDHAGWTSDQIAELPDLSGVAFHDPATQVAPGPLRLIRANAVANGNISTTLRVESVP